MVAAALLALALGGGSRPNTAGMLLVIAVGAAITTYSVIDGVGVRTSGNPFSYVAWLFLLQGVAVPIACFVLSKDKRGFAPSLRRNAPRGAIGGVLSLVSYAIVVWAQSLAPLALVSALRETGVLAAGLIGFVFFGERFTRLRVAATVVAVAGIVAIRVGT